MSMKTKEEFKEAQSVTAKDKPRYNRNNKSRNKSRTSGKTSESKPAAAAVVTTNNPAIQNIMTASSSIAVRNIAGNKVDLPMGSDPNITVNNATSRIPGVIQVAFAPLIGTATGQMTDPVNIAGRNIWMADKANYANAIPFTADHTIKVNLGIGSIFMAFSMIKRAYGVCLSYDARNKYVPDGLLAAMDIDPVDFRANLPDIRVTLNKVATQMNAFGVPAALKFIIDHVQYCNSIFLDDDTTSAQFIIPSPAFFWKLDWANDKMVVEPNIVDKHPSGSTPGSANWKAASTSCRSWATLKSMLTGLVESFVNYEDVYVVCADMRRIYGDMFQIMPVELDYAVQPVYSAKFLELMHNATYGHLDWSTWELTSVQAATNVGAISANYSTGYPTSTNPATDYRYIPELYSFTPGMYDFDVSDPTNDQIVDCTNWKYWVEFAENTASSTKVKIASCGTLAITDAAVIGLREISNVLQWAVLDISPKCASGRFYCWIEGSSNYFDGKMELWGKHPLRHGATISTITWKPIVANFNAGTPEGELDQYVTIDCPTIAKIHEAIILDRFDASGAGALALNAKAKK